MGVTNKTFIPEFIPVFTTVLHKEGLTVFDAMVYGTIWWFEKLKDGRCTAGNLTIARIIGSNNGTSVANSLKKLMDNGFISCYYKDDKKRQRTHIVTHSNPVVNTLQNESDSLHNDDVSLADDTVSLHNDTVSLYSEQNNNINNNNNNNINNTITENEVIPEQEETTPPGQIEKKFGDKPNKRILFFYNLFWQKEFGTGYKPNWGKDSIHIKNLLSRYNEVQLVALIATMFNWYGADGRNQKDHDFLVNAFFPLGMLFSAGNKYEVFIKNQEGRDFNSDAEMKSYVKALLDS